MCPSGVILDDVIDTGDPQCFGKPSRLKRRKAGVDPGIADIEPPFYSTRNQMRAVRVVACQVAP